MVGLREGVSDGRTVHRQRTVQQRQQVRHRKVPRGGPGRGDEAGRCGVRRVGQRPDEVQKLLADVRIDGRVGGGRNDVPKCDRSRGMDRAALMMDVREQIVGSGRGSLRPVEIPQHAGHVPGRTVGMPQRRPVDVVELRERIAHR